jgi:hypothetical protein
MLLFLKPRLFQHHFAIDQFGNDLDGFPDRRCVPVAQSAFGFSNGQAVMVVFFAVGDSGFGRLWQTAGRAKTLILQGKMPLFSLFRWS